MRSRAGVIELVPEIASISESLTDHLSLLKPGISAFAGLSALAGFFTAHQSGSPWPVSWAIAVFGLTFLASAGSCALNHAIEREKDKLMARTRLRPVASERITAGKAIAIGVTLIAASVLLSAVILGAAMSSFLLAGSLTYALIYTMWLKPRHWISVPVGGLCGTFAVLAGAFAQGNPVSSLPFIFALILFLWSPPHFWALGLCHIEDYRKAHIPSYPVVFGSSKTSKTVSIQLFLAFVASLLPLSLGYGYPFLMMTVAGSFFPAVSSVRLLKSPSNPARSKEVFTASCVYLLFLFGGVLSELALG